MASGWLQGGRSPFWRNRGRGALPFRPAPANFDRPPPQRFPEEENEGTKRVFLRRHRHGPFHCQVAEKGLHVLPGGCFQVPGGR
jgi:hypothetical protein